MAGTQELLDALRNARKAVIGVGEAPGSARVAEQEAAVARLEACLRDGWPKLEGPEAEAVASELKALLPSNRVSLEWTRLRARLARIGAPRPAPKAQDGPRLDLVS